MKIDELQGHVIFEAGELVRLRDVLAASADGSAHYRGGGANERALAHWLRGIEQVIRDNERCGTGGDDPAQLDLEAFIAKTPA